MILQAPTSFLSALIALAGGSPPPGVLRIMESLPGNLVAGPQQLADNTAVPALINSGAQTFALPTNFSTSWLYIPNFWLEVLLGLKWPQDTPLCLDQNCCCDFQGAWGATFQGLGWSAATPASGPWPILNV